MSEQMAAQMYAELNEMRALLARLQERVEDLMSQLNPSVDSNSYTLSSFIGISPSGLTDVSERHDFYVGQAVADEHLR